MYSNNLDFDIYSQNYFTEYYITHFNQCSWLFKKFSSNLFKSKSNFFVG